MNESLTHDEFKRLLDAYIGARNHEDWVRVNGTADEYARAINASIEARKALTKAVFG